jgi:hypothetical protein|tara:strand:+ start:8485 stop:8679 length:195 start_codon:yes stop_codon:yes gene_type:complete
MGRVVKSVRTGIYLISPVIFDRVDRAKVRHTVVFRSLDFLSDVPYSSPTKFVICPPASLICIEN